MLNITRRSLATAAKERPLKVGFIVSRIPIVTPEIPTLEKEYYQYQSELEQRLMWTFPEYFYFKKGTLAHSRYQAAQRGPIGKQPGVWFPKGLPEIKHNRERKQKQNIVLPKSTSETGTNSLKEDMSRPIIPNSRITEADKTNDITSLERKLDRTLYLVLKDSSNVWQFPNFPVEGSALHITAEAGLKELDAEDIHTWTVSVKPVASLQHKDGSTEFFIKSHILAGKFDLGKNSSPKLGFKEFAWLTKDEIQERVKDEYFANTGFLLADN